MSALAHGRYLIAGAGGLGGPIALALGDAGAALVLADPDTVEPSNLQRQVQFSAGDLGRRKVDALADVLAARGVDRDRIETVAAPVDAGNLDRLIASVDAVVDGTDSPQTKFLINDRCLAAGKPFVIAAAIRWTGHVIAVRPGQDGCYRCLFEGPPADAESCASAGVIGAVVGLIAGHAARLALQVGSVSLEAGSLSPPEPGADRVAMPAGSLSPPEPGADRVAMPAGSLSPPQAGGGSGWGAPAEILVWDHVGRSASPRVVQFHRRRGCPACAGRPRLTVKEAS